ncbi:MAG: cell wall hydrolase [Firmicutes bacterium]|nr:cell wall hydrolase [Bacillota bacterium]
MRREVEYLARTLYGEARGENLETLLYIGWVIRNRVKANSWFGDSYEEVVTKPYQFSSWLESDPNYRAIMNPKGDAWEVCKGIAQAIVHAKEEHNPIPGVYHYYDKSLDEVPPSWARSADILTFDYIPNLRFVRGVK